MSSAPLILVSVACILLVVSANWVGLDPQGDPNGNAPPLLIDKVGTVVFIRNPKGFYWFNHKAKFPNTIFQIDSQSQNAIGYKYDTGNVIKTEYDVVLSQMDDFGLTKKGKFKLIKAGTHKTWAITPDNGKEYPSDQEAYYKRPSDFADHVDTQVTFEIPLAFVPNYNSLYDAMDPVISVVDKNKAFGLVMSQTNQAQISQPVSIPHNSIEVRSKDSKTSVVMALPMAKHCIMLATWTILYNAGVVTHHVVDLTDWNHINWHTTRNQQNKEKNKQLAKKEKEKIWELKDGEYYDDFVENRLEEKGFYLQEAQVFPAARSGRSHGKGTKINYETRFADHVLAGAGLTMFRTLKHVRDNILKQFKGIYHGNTPINEIAGIIFNTHVLGTLDLADHATALISDKDGCFWYLDTNEQTAFAAPYLVPHSHKVFPFDWDSFPEVGDVQASSAKRQTAKESPYENENDRRKGKKRIKKNKKMKRFKSSVKNKLKKKNSKDDQVSIRVPMEYRWSKYMEHKWFPMTDHYKFGYNGHFSGIGKKLTKLSKYNAQFSMKLGTDLNVVAKWMIYKNSILPIGRGGASSYQIVRYKNPNVPKNTAVYKPFNGWTRISDFVFVTSPLQVWKGWDSYVISAKNAKMEENGDWIEEQESLFDVPSLDHNHYEGNWSSVYIFVILPVILIFITCCCYTGLSLGIICAFMVSQKNVVLCEMADDNV